MYIQPMNSYDISMHGGRGPKDIGKFKKFLNRVKQAVLDVFPEKSVKEIANAEAIDNKLSHPAINRIVMGATAILTQPAIDYYNHKVDEETREVARNRTAAKIIAGTAVGAIVRESSFKVVKKMTNMEAPGRYSKALIPKSYLQKFAESPKKLKNYRNALSTITAIAVMCITNFALDAPLTTLLTNRFNAKTMRKRALKQQNIEKEVANG